MNATTGCKEARGGETPPALAGEDACATSVKYPGWVSAERDFNEDPMPIGVNRSLAAIVAVSIFR